MILRRVVMMMVVMMVMAGSKSGRTGKDREQQNDSENLLHGRHPSRIEFGTEAPARCLNLKEQRGQRYATCVEPWVSG